MYSMERKLNYVMVQEEDAFVARCLDVEVASDGPTEAAAIEALKEALDLFFEDHSDTLAHLPPRTYQFGEIVIHA